MELKHDIFIIPSEKNDYIVYSPLRGCAFYANLKAVDIIRRYVNDSIFSESDKTTKIWEYIKKLENKIARIQHVSATIP
jgi:hypothetical protein